MKIRPLNHDNRWVFHCPACKGEHVVRVCDGGWDLLGDAEKPTLNPSVLVTTPFVDRPTHRCHSFIRNGKIAYCSDSTHKFAGQTVEMEDVPEDSLYAEHFK